MARWTTRCRAPCGAPALARRARRFAPVRVRARDAATRTGPHGTGARPLAAAQRGVGAVAGIGLLSVCVPLLVVGLRFSRGGAHPLTPSDGFDLCAWLGAKLWDGVPGAHGVLQTATAGLTSGNAATCYLPLEAPQEPGAQPPHVRAIVLSHRMLATNGARVSTAKYVATFLAETKADGSRVPALTGPWRSGALILRDADRDVQLRADDDGVVLWLGARGVEAPVLAQVATAMARQLRAAR